MKMKTLSVLAFLLSNLLFILSASAADPRDVCSRGFKESPASKLVYLDWYTLVQGENPFLPYSNIEVLSSDHTNGTCVFKFHGLSNTFLIAKADVNKLHYCEGYRGGFLTLRSCKTNI